MAEASSIPQQIDGLQDGGLSGAVTARQQVHAGNRLDAELFDYSKIAYAKLFYAHDKKGTFPRPLANSEKAV